MFFPEFVIVDADLISSVYIEVICSLFIDQADTALCPVVISAGVTGFAGVLFFAVPPK
jgi:hypothetical protein